VRAPRFLVALARRLVRTARFLRAFRVDRGRRPGPAAASLVSLAVRAGPSTCRA